MYACMKYVLNKINLRFHKDILFIIRKFVQQTYLVSLSHDIIYIHPSTPESPPSSSFLTTSTFSFLTTSPFHAAYALDETKLIIRRIATTKRVAAMINGLGETTSVERCGIPTHRVRQSQGLGETTSVETCGIPTHGVRQLYGLGETTSVETCGIPTHGLRQLHGLGETTSVETCVIPTHRVRQSQGESP